MEISCPRSAPPSVATRMGEHAPTNEPTFLKKTPRLEVPPRCTRRSAQAHNASRSVSRVEFDGDLLSPVSSSQRSYPNGRTRSDQRTDSSQKNTPVRSAASVHPAQRASAQRQ